MHTSQQIANRVLDLRRQAFGKLLESFVPQTSFVQPQHARIIDAACGQCEEGATLVDYFGRNGSVYLLGIDTNSKSIERARQLNANQKSNADYRFVHGDARHLDSYDGNFDVVVARHPDTINQISDWLAILRVVDQVTRRGSLFIGTTYEKKEMSSIRYDLEKRYGFEIKVDRFNPFAEQGTRFFITDNLGIRDNYVLMGIKT